MPGADAGPRPASVDTTDTSGETTSAGRRSRQGGLSRKGWIRVVSLVAAVGLWQLASSTGALPESKLASPVSVAHTAYTLIVSDNPAYGTLQHSVSADYSPIPGLYGP